MAKTGIRVVCPLALILWLAACAGDQVAVPRSFETVAKPVAKAQGLPGPQGAVVGVSSNRHDDTAIPDGVRQPALKTPQAQPQAIKPILTPAAKRPASLPKPPPAKVPPLIPIPTPDLRQLVGLDRGELSALLGKPILRRNEHPAEVWQYGAGQCVLHVFLYADGASGPYRVSHIDAVPRQQSVVKVGAITGSQAAGVDRDIGFSQNCFGQLLNRSTAQNETGKSVF